MRSRSENAQRLLVSLETAPGSGEFELDPRLRVEEVRQRADRAISSARLSLQIDDEMDCEEARRRYHPERRILVATGEADPASRALLFEGYPPRQSWRWDGRVGGECEEYIFEAEHVLERLTRAPEAMVYGRRVRTGAIEDGLQTEPAAYAGRSALMTALPCVFNPDGVANRAAAPLTVTAPDGQDRAIHIFTWDGDPEAAKWTYGTALRYLVWFHRVKAGPVFEGNIFPVTEWLTSGGANPGGALASALAREPVSLSCEATSLAEAMALLAAAAGIHITAETDNLAGRPVTRLRVWAAEDGTCKHLYLALGGRYPDGQPRYATTGRSAAAVLADNNIHRGEVAWEGHGGPQEALVLGDVKRYEMTVPLWPGWLARELLDNVEPAMSLQAKAEALTPAMVHALGPAAAECAWFRQYHREGADFAQNSDVARLWVLNEDGYYTPEGYNRNDPFNDYGPFDFTRVADAAVTSAGAWMRRARRLLPLISRSEHRRRLGVWVEISFDSGVNWQQQPSGIKVLEDRVGIYLDCENPTEIAPAGVDPGVQNLWYALIDGTLRVRVSGVIESDERLIGRAAPQPCSTAGFQVTTTLVRRPKGYQLVSRQHTENALIQVTTAPDERDDSQAIAAFAEALRESSSGRGVRAVPAIPWVETAYGLGDRITEIRGRQIRLALGSQSAPRWPAVLERRFVLRDGCYETVLTLADSPPPIE